MKKTFLTLALASLTAVTFAQSVTSQDVTNKYNEVVAKANSLTNAPAEAGGKQAGGWELTLGGGGESFRGENFFGLDFSLSTNPLKCCPEIWFGISQSLYWQPTFAGSTDLSVDWSQSILPKLLNDRLYLNLGWSGGALYDNTGAKPIWRSGPEATFQFYTSDNAFIYAGANYDVYRSENTEGGWRYSFGLGLSF